MNDNTNEQYLEDWEPCDGGELRQAVWRVKAERRNRDMVKAGGAVVVLLLCAFAATLIWQQVSQSESNDYGGISCKEVKSNLAAFAQGKIQDEQLAKRLRDHLGECPHCGPAYKKMSDSTAVSQIVPHRNDCDCESHRPTQETFGRKLLAVGQAN